MLEMPSDLDRPWEPWAPKEGDRVRVRLSGECQAQFRGSSTGEVSRHRAQDGAKGTVLEVMTGDHPYRVGFDVWIRTNYGYIASEQMAAIELELLEDNGA